MLLVWTGEGVTVILSDLPSTRALLGRRLSPVIIFVTEV